MTDRLISEWQDSALGFLRTGQWSTGSAFGLGAYESAITACSNAGLIIVTMAAPDISVSSPNPGNVWYLTVDTATLLFDTGVGTSVTVTIPGPKQALFKPDTLTIDPTQTDVANLISTVIGFITDNAGNAATAFSQGQRSSRRTEQNAGF